MRARLHVLVSVVFPVSNHNVCTQRTTTPNLLSECLVFSLFHFSSLHLNTVIWKRRKPEWCIARCVVKFEKSLCVGITIIKANIWWFHCMDSSVVFSIFVFFDFGFHSFSIWAACLIMRACIRRKVSTYNLHIDKERERTKISRFFFCYLVWRESEVRDRHIPSMEYFMQNANNNVSKTTWDLLIQSAIILCVFFAHASIYHYLPIVMPIVWLLMTLFHCCGLKSNWMFYSQWQWTITLYSLLLKHTIDRKYLMLETILRST